MNSASDWLIMHALSFCRRAEGREESPARAEEGSGLSALLVSLSIHPDNSR